MLIKLRMHNYCTKIYYLEVPFPSENPTKQRLLTIVGKCRTCASEDIPDEVRPPNIIAWSSSIKVREKLSQGGDLDPLIDGEDHNPKQEHKKVCILPLLVIKY